MFQIDPNWFYVSPRFIIITIIITAVLFIAFVAFAVQRGIRAHHYRISAGKEDLEGKTAEAETPLTPKGIVFVQGERWTAISEDERIRPGEEVVITRVDGLKLYVKKKE
ncbi:NfeD family protein [Chloroflexota bacterium]